MLGRGGAVPGSGYGTVGTLSRRLGVAFCWAGREQGLGLAQLCRPSGRVGRCHLECRPPPPAPACPLRSPWTQGAPGLSPQLRFRTEAGCGGLAGACAPAAAAAWGWSCAYLVQTEPHSSARQAPVNFA